MRNNTSLGAPISGFTLIEVMIAIAIVAIVAAIALPSYAAYIERARVPPALEALTSYHVRMEQRFQDAGSYGDGACAVPLPAAASFSINCALTEGGTGFIATASGSGSMAGYAYTIDQDGRRMTVSHPKGAPASPCWSMKGMVCDDA